MPEAQHPENLSSEQLLPLVYEELRRLATSRMASQAAGMTLQPTALVHEAWLRLAGKKEQNWNNRVHFFRAAALAMRHILIDRARQKNSLKHYGKMVALDLSSFDLGEFIPNDGLLLLDEALKRFEHEDPDSARIILLKFFAGLTNTEVASNIGVNVRTVERQWAYAKARLFQIIREMESGSGAEP